MREELWLIRRNEIATCAYMGMTVAEAAEETGFSTATVRSLAKRFGLKFPDARGRRPMDLEAIRARYQPLADKGLTLKEAAEQLGEPYPTVVSRAKAAGVAFIRHWERDRPVDRDETVASMYRAGKTLMEIGEIYGITRERVRQILSKFGVSATDGGQSLRARIAEDRRQAKREAKCLLKNGCTLAQLEELRAVGIAMRKEGESYFRTPIGAFNCQRNSAANRGIDWKLTLWEWWTIWQESKRWEDRGRGHGYMMCRFGDAGAYEVGNVYISTGVHNGAVQPNNPYRKSHPDFEEVMRNKTVRHERGCSIPGCEQRHYGRGYCNSHYYQHVLKPARQQEKVAA